MKHIKKFNEDMFLGKDEIPVISSCIVQDGNGNYVVKMETAKGEIFYSKAYIDGGTSKGTKIFK